MESGRRGMITIAQRYAWYVGSAIVLLAALMFACHARDEHLLAQGRDEGRMAVLQEKTAKDSSADRVASAVVTRDTIRLTRWLVKRDTLRTTLHITDTVEVKQFIAVQDSTIKECRQTLVDFAVSCARKDTIISDLRGQLAIRMPPQPRVTWKEKLAWGIGGAVTGYVAGRMTP